MVVPPFLKLTVPLGVPPGPETVAVRVVATPAEAGEGEAERTVEVAAVSIVNDVADDVEVV
jgi:hypothetical protein